MFIRLISFPSNAYRTWFLHPVAKLHVEACQGAGGSVRNSQRRRQFCELRLELDSPTFFLQLITTFFNITVYKHSKNVYVSFLGTPYLFPAALTAAALLNLRDIGAGHAALPHVHLRKQAGRIAGLWKSSSVFSSFGRCTACCGLQ